MKMYGEDKLLGKKKVEKVKKAEKVKKTKKTRETEPKKKKRRGLKALIITFSVIAALALTGIALWYTNVQAPDIATPNKPETTVKGDSESGKLNIKEADRKEDIYNILIIGTDLNGYHTDSMMLTQFDAKNNKMNVLSIPRDLITKTPKGNYIKINSAYHGSVDNLDKLYDEIEKVVGYRPKPEILALL